MQPAPAERLATILLWLRRAVAARSAAGIPGPLIVLIVGRISHIGQRLARVAARIRDGRYVPRRRPAQPGPAPLRPAPLRPAPLRPAPLRRPRQPTPLPRRSGWLLRLVPEAAGYRAQLEHLLRDAEMAALLAAAPAAMARPIRSLCWMLQLPPPPILTPPILTPPILTPPILTPPIPAPRPGPRPAPPQAAPAAAPASPPPHPPPPASPAPWRTAIAPPPPPARACGPPLPACAVGRPRAVTAA
jgi:hypothetical protein